MPFEENDPKYPDLKHRIWVIKMKTFSFINALKIFTLPELSFSVDRRT